MEDITSLDWTHEKHHPHGFKPLACSGHAGQGLWASLIIRMCLPQCGDLGLAESISNLACGEEFNHRLESDNQYSSSENPSASGSTNSLRGKIFLLLWKKMPLSITSGGWEALARHEIQSHGSSWLAVIWSPVNCAYFDYRKALTPSSCWHERMMVLGEILS